MAEWAWEARARTGEVRKGVMEADDEEAVNSACASRTSTRSRSRRRPRRIKLSFGAGVTPQDLVIFTRLFATMIDAGLPLVQCLDILSGQGRTRLFDAVLKDVKNTVEQGATFSDALKRHPKIFDELFVNLVQAGEIGGILDTILNRLAIYIEKRVKLQRQVRARCLPDRGHLHRAWRVDSSLMLDLRHPGLREDVRGVRRPTRCPP